MDEQEKHMSEMTCLLFQESGIPRSQPVNCTGYFSGEAYIEYTCKQNCSPELADGSSINDALSERVDAIPQSMKSTLRALSIGQEQQHLTLQL